MKHIRSNKGTSIVEVLVVMVVLLIGIMSVVRIFPWGFLSVRSAENTTFAGRLAQYEIERWKNNAENLPDGILPVGLVNGTMDILHDRYPGPPVVDDPADKDNATTFRRVIGETTRIPFGGWTAAPMGGSAYMLAFAPIDNPATLAVRGGNLTRRLISSDEINGIPAWLTIRGYQYAIDYDNHQICFIKVGQARMYYLNISWWEHDSGGAQVLRTATSVPILVSANTEKWIDLVDVLVSSNYVTAANFINLESYTDSVCRGFRSLSLNDAWSSDAYECKLVDPVMGILLFNPVGYSQKEFGKSLVAKIDYDICDSQIIHEDKVVPKDYSGAGAPQHKVRLTLQRIKQLDDEYLGLKPGPPYNLNTDLLAIDLETTLPLKIQTEAGVPADRRWVVDYKSGIITLPQYVTTYDPVTGNDVDPNIHPAGRNVRFFYKAEGDWAVQMMKAYSQYERVEATQPLTYLTYAIESDKIWFSGCNGNHTIAVDYEWDNNGVTTKVVGECHKTSDILENHVGNPSTWLTLAHVPTTVNAVRGVSVKARVIWREGDRWKNVDLDTILTRQTAD